MLFNWKCRVLKHRFLAFSPGAGGFKELRGASRNHFHLSWYLIVPRITSYGQKLRGVSFFNLNLGLPALCHLAGGPIGGGTQDKKK